MRNGTVNYSQDTRNQGFFKHQMAFPQKFPVIVVSGKAFLIHSTAICDVASILVIVKLYTDSPCHMESISVQRQLRLRRVSNEDKSLHVRCKGAFLFGVQVANKLRYAAFTK